jgi:hypothetical protein
MSADDLNPAAILYTNGPFTGVQSTVLPNPPPDTLTGDAYVGINWSRGGEPMYERTTYHRYDCVDGVWLYEVRLDR